MSESTNPLCKYKHIFGVEGKGVHSYRIVNIAVVDMLLTLFGAWLIAKYIHKPLWIVFIIVLIIGTFIHRILCVKTTITKIVFGTNY